MNDTVDFMKKIGPVLEIVAAVGFATAIALSTEEQSLVVLTIISLSALSLLYAINARIHLFDATKSWPKRLVSFLNFTGIAIALMGFLFAFNHYPGADIMLQAGSVITVVGVIGIAFFKRDAATDLFEFKLPLIRSGVVLLLALSMLI